MLIPKPVRGDKREDSWAYGSIENFESCIQYLPYSLYHLYISIETDLQDTRMLVAPLINSLLTMKMEFSQYEGRFLKQKYDP